MQNGAVLSRVGPDGPGEQRPRTLMQLLARGLQGGPWLPEAEKLDLASGGSIQRRGSEIPRRDYL